LNVAAQTRLLCALAAAVGAAVGGCSNRKLQEKDPATIVGVAGMGASGAGVGGAAGGGPSPEPCDDSDPRLVIAPQRTLLLTSTQLVNSIEALTNDGEARAIVDEGVFQVTTDFQRRFPPTYSEQFRSIPDSTTMTYFTALARHVAKYVFDNFGKMTNCPPGTDACAETYLDKFAEKAYRRPLDASEQSGLDARWEAARGVGTTEEATREVITAILTAPQFLFRSEMGDPSRASVSPPGVPLTPYELASALSFFLTDRPPDQPLLDDARAGTLPDTLATHVDRLLATPAARAWLTKLVETLYTLNQLPGAIIDPSKFPIVSGGSLYGDVQQEAHLFLDEALWNGKLTDLLLSRTTFLNSNLATMVYGVPAPPGATPTTFVRTTLPAEQRSGLLTSAGFITRWARSTGVAVDRRGLYIGALMLCREFPPPPETAWDGERAQAQILATQTAQEQVGYRASMPLCASCHVHFEPYGAALDEYDVVGRVRTVDDLGKPVDAHATLPPELGGVTIRNAVDLARVIGLSPMFKGCMAKNMLTYALTDAWVELPSPTDGKAGCAAADVVRRFDAGGAATFSGLMRAVALSQAFALRLPN